jgi:hypothetical protein
MLSSTPSRARTMGCLPHRGQPVCRCTAPGFEVEHSAIEGIMHLRHLEMQWVLGSLGWPVLVALTIPAESRVSAPLAAKRNPPTRWRRVTPACGALHARSPPPREATRVRCPRCAKRRAPDCQWPALSQFFPEKWPRRCRLSHAPTFLSMLRNINLPFSCSALHPIDCDPASGTPARGLKSVPRL